MRRGCKVNRGRRQLTLGLALAAAAISSRAAAPNPVIEVWTGPECDCCKAWVKHLEANGFRTMVHDGGNTEARVSLGMPIGYGGCHPAKVGEYAIEGHVPVREIKRLLIERPWAVGLAVPGMPRGSPGMDGSEFKGARDPFEVLLVQRDGSNRVYQAYL